MKYYHFDNMTWPSPLNEDLAWNLIHTERPLTKSERCYIASIISAYRVIVLQSNQKNRNTLCKKIKAKLTQIKETEG